MRKIIVSLCILFAALTLKAQTISGIRVDGGNIPVLVYISGNQMCLPTTTCFVANLRPDYYRIEVYATRNTRPGERVWRGDKLFDERMYFNGNELKEIYVGRNNDRPDRPGTGDYRPGRDRYDRVMDDRLFSDFLTRVKKEPFSDNRMKLIETALVNSYFTCGQCLSLVKLYTFDDDKMKIMKMIYPRIVDREGFFTLIDSLTFSSNKDEMNDFVKSQGNRR
ncbi:DUF4476 domain-containing protein [Bacteroides reticulotermitis]|uniref:DUF4476 domain-containing protein n=2 Tax=Bacteroides reticulotermitis TaxID=1133319 RepID=W4UW62_9BACE|nr:DUF4476 domain-containing protein [Bacteroides reticulotermitis]MBB4046055.1 hypothetical protein [Bacteroides reticulotermitis]GAE85445.1 hypothetical protein JCM10512_3879 [Bacteroides reticulotermitis JCM 10512]HJD77266.1 DUF4476 domain-containing protein [Bacteroides reticulotermitis]